MVSFIACSQILGYVLIRIFIYFLVMFSHFFLTLSCRNFPISLQGSHVIDADQVWLGVVSRGCDNVKLNSSYGNR